MNKVLTITALSGVLFVSSNAMSAGFHLHEQSAAAQGNAFAGATAGAENNTYAYYNVAGITRQAGTQLTMGATYIAPKASAHEVEFADGRRDADVENVVHAAISPYSTFSYQLNDKTYAGISLNVPYGMITKYDHEWAGSDHGITSDIKTATFTPMLAYKATDKLSLGAGLQIQYLWAHLTSSNHATQTKVVTTNGKALDVGYQLGALYEFTPKTRVGIGYRSEIKHKLKGKMRATPSGLPYPVNIMADSVMNQKISVRLDTPSMLSLGVYHDINDKWSVMAEYQRVFWSSLQHLNFVSRADGSTIARVEEHWRDANFFAVGASYWLDEQWKLRLGLAYDQSAVRYQHRTPRVPDSDRTWYSVGLGYKYSENLSFDTGFTYISAKSAMLDTSITGNNGENARAKYSNSVKAISLSMTYAF